MTPDDTDMQERAGDDILAAEYVLGVLPSDERGAAADRIVRDSDFARLVENWENHFSPLNAAYEEVAPPAHVWGHIEGRLFGPQDARAPRAGLLQSLNFWRGLSAAAIAGLLLMVVLPFLAVPPTDMPDHRFVASLASTESPVSYLAMYDAGSGEVALSHISGDREAGRDFELWVIEGDNAPVSLGVIPVGASVRMAVADDRREPIATGSLFAISLEPVGGSPTGAPTGPVVAAGDLRTI